MFNEILEQYGTLIGFLALIGIELSPIKFNPFSLLGKICGKLLGINELNEKIKEVEKKVEKTIEETNKNELDRIRYEILQFSGSLRNGLQRTENDYQHIEEIFEKYEKKGGNSYIHSEMEFIRDCHNEMVDIKK